LGSDLRRHRGIEASSRGKAEEKTSADYADYAVFLQGIIKKKRKAGRGRVSHAEAQRTQRRERQRERQRGIHRLRRLEQII